MKQLSGHGLACLVGDIEGVLVGASLLGSQKRLHSKDILSVRCRVVF
jgi:hypothetical protein